MKLPNALRSAWIVLAYLALGVGAYACKQGGTWIRTGDGREVFCIPTGYTMSCDWENARPLQEPQP